MSRIRISKVTAVPAVASIEANTIYLVSVGTDEMEVYVSNNAGDSLRRLPTTNDIQSLIDAAITGISAIEVVDDIAARDALSLTSNTMVIVEDASGDATVNVGSALYVYKASDSSFRKLAEFESLDVVLDWGNIQNRPSASPAQIDAAVSNAHTHANQSQLDLLDQDGDGDLTYNGDKVANTYSETAW